MLRHISIATCLIYWGLLPISSQVLDLIPNGGFEQVDTFPEKWYYNGADFSNSVIDWFATSDASPDLYGPDIEVPQGWLSKGFGNVSAIEGSYFVGITLYGCKTGKPHCREYISVHLKEAMVIDQTYRLELWIQALDGGLWTNNLGFFFSESKLGFHTDGLVPLHPQLNYGTLIRTQKDQWKKLRFDFTADKQYRFITIGNFFADESTLTEINRRPYLPYGYYYLDQIQLKKLPPIIEATPDDLAEWFPLEKKQVLKLENIYFDFDQFVANKESIGEIQKLAKLMKVYPDLEIRIAGHTDRQGTLAYNQKLSERRAQNIKNYLLALSVDGDRVRTVGYAFNKSICEEENEECHALNRRVEVEVIHF